MRGSGLFSGAPVAPATARGRALIAGLPRRRC